MKTWRVTSLKSKLLIFSILNSLILGFLLGLVWLYIENSNIIRENTVNINIRRRQIGIMLVDEFRKPHYDLKDAAQHAGRVFFSNKQILEAEITDPDGMILAAKDKKLVGKKSDDAGEIKESVRKKGVITDFFALRKPGDISHRQKINKLSPFDWRPKAQEFTAPIIIDGQVELVLHIYLSLDRLTFTLRNLAFVTIVITLSIAAVAALVAFFVLDRLIYRRIFALEEVAQRIAAGDLNERVPEVGQDEFGELANRFNTMTDSLVSAQYQASTDPLTGIFNYRHLQDHLASKIALAGRYKRDLTVTMLDIDRFKSVNDLYGHATGDEVLMMTVNFLASQLRQVDYLARYGGEEFVIVMPETGGASAMKVMERILAGFPKNVYVERMGIRNPVYISAGVADYPLCGEDTVNLLAAADMALLLSKRRGRNQVTYFRTIDQKAG